MESYRYAQCDVCGLRIGTVRIDTRSDARRGDDRGVVAFIACQREYVLGGEVDAQVLNQLAVLRTIGIAQSDVVELEVVAVLEEIA